MGIDINLKLNGDKYVVVGPSPEIEAEILAETMNCMSKKSLNSAVNDIKDASGYALSSMENRTILNAIHQQLSIPLLSDAIDYTGTISAQATVDDVKCEVELRKSEFEPYVIVQVKNKDHLFGSYAIGVDGEFLMGDVLEIIKINEEDINKKEFLEYYASKRDDEFSLFAIVQAMDEIKKQILEKLKEYQKTR